MVDFDVLADGIFLSEEVVDDPFDLTEERHAALRLIFFI